MEGHHLRGCSTTYSAHALPLHTLKPSRRVGLNRVFAAVYTCAIIALFYRHAQTLLCSKTLVSFYVTLTLFISDLILAFMWANGQAFRMRPVYRKEYPENIEKAMKRSDFPALDVFICTADPWKEPPMRVVNTALSVMAYDYPTEKISVYVSDDGGSALTLFAFMEAAKFAAHWLPFCRKNNVVERSPDEYFASNYSRTPETEKIKIMYESMKVRVEHVVETGKVGEEYITSDHDRHALSKWTDEFTRQNHPTVIQVLLEQNKDTDVAGHWLPNLVYVSRQKSKTSPHHFKAGALNVLLRASAAMTNAPLILTLDCDMYSNDPGTPIRVLCYVLDPEIQNKLAYIQFPQEFHGLNKSDIYACEHKHLFKLNPIGFDGLSGPNYVGTGCFFRRRAFFGRPSTLVLPEIKELSPDYVVNKPITAQSVLELAHHVAGCNYEDQTKWGSKIGFRYGSLVEDYYTGFRLQCEGWMSIFCCPERAAFLGDVPFNLLDALGQNKRWAIGLLEVAFSRYSTITYGVKAMGLLMGLGYSYYAFWAALSIPVTTYSFLPQLALHDGVSIFPKVSEPWFFLYMFLFLGAYGQDCLDFVLGGGTIQRWWSNQRMWMIKGLSCYLFGLTEFLLKSIGISTQGFNVTSKVIDDEQSKRYDQGRFEFGVPSPMFVTLTMAAIINLFSFICGLVKFLNCSNKEGLFMQLFLTGSIVMNCLPIYQAMALRSDKGKMPIRTTITATFLASALYAVASIILK
ncbi:cellulose synthase-like protein G3 isoform X1 [Herrania umbratica]|uniref:Cellulose synthase-like protein G3 isoform X1 n=2 Tax=Herrania umbratica TaxID=108875 RepID=A0A6J0ZWG4_9ROSI|nr:cellulose synthase-like protein G3 isoform X1 [Herrania umbratica]